MAGTAKVLYDSDWYTRCEGCFAAIQPDEPKIVIGTLGQELLEVYCTDCAPKMS